MAVIGIGTVLYGFCNGYFGRDSYGEKRIEAMGCDWIVVREVDTGMPDFASFDGHSERMMELLETWSGGGALGDDEDY